ncbi:response regulator [Marinoscillum sp.]|uniref:response regulator n=1 Tax=Marinoscillum sp. TaxID=2024838 RepID=UPI003BA9B93D
MSTENLKVLIVEDNLVNQMVLSKILKSKGCVTDLAQDGIEAVEKALEQEHDLILMDVQMPGKNGIEATMEIRKSKPDKPIIIALTASALGEDKNQCLQAGMNDYLTKPIAKDQLEMMMQKWF